MLHRIHYRFKNVPLSVLTGLSVFLAVLVPLLIGSVLFYFRSRSYLLELEGKSLSASLSTLHSSEVATPDAISADTERLLRQLSSDKAYSYYILDEDDAVVASGSRGEIIFPLEQYPSGQILQAATCFTAAITAGKRSTRSPARTAGIPWSPFGRFQTSRVRGGRFSF